MLPVSWSKVCLNQAACSWEIVTDPAGLRAVSASLRDEGVPVESSELTMLPQTSIPVGGSEARQVLQLIEALEELDDVQSVFANFDIPESVLEAVAS